MKKVKNLYSKLKKALMVAGGSLYMTFASANYVLADTGVGQVEGYPVIPSSLPPRITSWFAIAMSAEAISFLTFWKIEE